MSKEKSFTSLGIEGDMIPNLREQKGVILESGGDYIVTDSSYDREVSISERDLGVGRRDSFFKNDENYEDLINAGCLRLSDIACPRGCFLLRYLRRP